MLLAPLALVPLAGCVQSLTEVGRAPTLAPVGSGLTAYHEPMPAEAFPVPVRAGFNSLWDDSRADLYRDPRARNVGDVLKVEILIDDRASLDNSTDRSRNSQGAMGLGLFLDSEALDYSLAANGAFNGSSSSKGEGSVDRSEKIRLSVAAVVTEVLPNGNLLISGSQEVRVNFELRVLNIAGIVRPRDISKDNSITYDKIAEARVSYGGRGRLTEVQQPGWGQQIYDIVTPY
jgi:flagellar L-ring protein precursor FlgH